MSHRAVPTIIPMTGGCVLFGQALVSASPTFFRTMPVMLTDHSLVAPVFAQGLDATPLRRAESGT